MILVFFRKRKTSKSLQRPSRTRLTRSAKRLKRICPRWTFTSGTVHPARRTTPCTRMKNETGSACHHLCQTSFQSENLTKIEQRPGKYSFSGHFFLLINYHLADTFFCLTNNFSVREFDSDKHRSGNGNFFIWDCNTQKQRNPSVR